MLRATTLFWSVVLLLDLLSCTCSASEGGIFSPYGCLNEYEGEINLPVTSDFELLKLHLDIEVPEYTSDMSQIVSATLQREYDPTTWVDVPATQMSCPIFSMVSVCERHYKRESYNISKSEALRVHMTRVYQSYEEISICIVMNAVPLGKYGELQVYLASAVFLLVFIFLSFELVSRTLVTLFGCIVLFIFVWASQAMPSLQEMCSWLDWDTIVLLMSMMTIMVVFAQTGFFEYSAWAVLKISRKWPKIPMVTRRWIIFFTIGTFTMAASAFLDNCTTVLLMAPMSVRIATLLDCEPKPFLMALVYFCTLGGGMTYIGDPPNLIIGNYFGLGFNDFLVNCAPCIIMMLPMLSVIMYMQFRAMLRTNTRVEMNVPELQNLSAATIPYVASFANIPKIKSLSVSNRRTSSPPLNAGPTSYSVSRLPRTPITNQQPPAPRSSEDILTSPGSHMSASLKPSQIKEFLDGAVVAGFGDDVEETPSVTTGSNDDMTGLLEEPPEPTAHTGEIDDEVAHLLNEGGTQIIPVYRLRDPAKFVKCVVVLSGVLIGFLVETWTGLSAALVSVAGAGILLLIASHKDITEILEKVEWPTLLFFSYLFIFVKLADRLSLTYTLTSLAETLIGYFPEKYQLSFAVIFIIWISGLLACWCNNIAFTIAILPLIYQIGYDPNLKCAMRPLAWALSLGVSMSANGTLIAAAPNLIVANIAVRSGTKLSFLRFMGWGFPFMLSSLVMVSVYCIVFYCILGFQN
ncbi:P protein [Pelomyxa schiedti]|nr:P protein [Pelomyxa schiedti]